MNLNEIMEIDLPSLKSIQLGQYALRGRKYDKSCSLRMRSIIEMDRND